MSSHGAQDGGLSHTSAPKLAFDHPSLNDDWSGVQSLGDSGALSETEGVQTSKMSFTRRGTMTLAGTGDKRIVSGGKPTMHVCVRVRRLRDHGHHVQRGRFDAIASDCRVGQHAIQAA